MSREVPASSRPPGGRFRPLRPLHDHPRLAAIDPDWRHRLVRALVRHHARWALPAELAAGTLTVVAMGLGVAGAIVAAAETRQGTWLHSGAVAALLALVVLTLVGGTTVVAHAAGLVRRIAANLVLQRVPDLLLCERCGYAIGDRSPRRRGEACPECGAPLPAWLTAAATCAAGKRSDGSGA